MSAYRRRGRRQCGFSGLGFTVWALGLGGCHHQITTRNGSCLRGCIQCADADALYVAPDARGRTCLDYTGDLHVVQREEVLEITHPGPVATVGVGGGMIFAGAVLSIAGIVFLSEEKAQDPHAEQLVPLLFFLPSGLLTAGGSVAVTLGFWNWMGARELVEAPGPACKSRFNAPKVKSP